ncbi:2-aminoethylphosphonate--pyruvate transaminase [Desulfatirhabdium butyrativorans]|uniref:2-aminoethylphosphonate--pyruvate transaminase n=1 Tax=Desulfatirhabdium butyrativorans TaxID=340467 RepID=UPI000A05ED0B|nr:2-aminoethylphosphonate--pyruvate transaminase [Desulfatirhabdium butyrativorans]
MNASDMPKNPYLLLTPGPLTTTASVKWAMMQDWCTWDDDYKQIVQDIRSELVSLATSQSGYTAVLMQGSGTFGVESVLTSAVPQNGKLLVLANGVYGRRMVHIARKAGIRCCVSDSGETKPPDLDRLKSMLTIEPSISHVAVVHCETTTGMLNPILEIGNIVNAFRKVFIVDAMSSFGGIPLDMAQIHADYLISSANKCIQGVPGFSFIIAREDELRETRDRAKSLSLDLFDQWEAMENDHGKWRFTSPTHVVRAFAQALAELKEEGGIEARYHRYAKNQLLLVSGMKALGFQPLLPEPLHSPIITAFRYPNHPGFDFGLFYRLLKQRGFVIYPGKVTDIDTFRIGSIGDVHEQDISRLLQAVERSMYWRVGIPGGWEQGLSKHRYNERVWI